MLELAATVAMIATTELSQASVFDQQVEREALQLRLIRVPRNFVMYKGLKQLSSAASIVGLVVEFVVAIDEARVRFTDDAFFFALFLFLTP